MKKLFFFLSSLIIIPIVIIYILNKTEERNFNLIKNQIIRVKHDSNGLIEEVPLESYIRGVVAGEMPISFSLEALKAQAVAARSYVLKKVEYNKTLDYDIIDTQVNQVYYTDSELIDAWEDKYDSNMAKISTAVNSTSGEYIDYNGEIADAFFFSTSTGETENSGEIFMNQLPYLVSVDSSWDSEVSPLYSTNKYFSLEEFYNLLDIPYNDDLDIEVIRTTSTGRMRELKINGYYFTSNDITDYLDLRSSYFNIEQVNDSIVVNEKGYGHGVGMSQYGAEAMAKRGYKYDEILKHYYTGVSIKKI